MGLQGGLSAASQAELVTAAETDVDTRVRSAALAALVRTAGADGGPVDPLAVWLGATTDPDAAVRRRAGELAPLLLAAAPRSEERRTEVVGALSALLADPDVTVVEAAAWGMGEIGQVGGAAVTALARTVTDHSDALAREAAVAALGAAGDPAGCPAVLLACGDRPAVRRRAVLALAPFEGPEVDAAIEAALTDRDWQVRQAAEDLRRPDE